MASTKLMQTKDGRAFYQISVSRGYGKTPYSTRWYVPEGWSKRSIERGLASAAADFEAKCKAGAVLNRAEQKQLAEAEAAERAKIQTLKQYGEQVFMPRLMVHCSENTRSSYQSNLNNHIYPVLGARNLPEITSADIDAFLLSLQTEKHLAHASVIKVYQILSQLFRQAYKGHAGDNPMLDVERPKAAKSENYVADEDRYFNAQELRYILACLDQEVTRTGSLKWKAFIFLAAETGARRGELCGLRWRDIDFSENTIHLSTNLCYTPKAGIYEDTLKTKTSRVVDISDELASLLKEYKAEQLQRFNNVVPLNGFLFVQEDGIKPMHPQSPDRYFSRFGERYQVPDFHPHKLRHSFASVAINNGAPVASVAKKLGHHDSSTTLRMYTHSDLDAVRGASDIFRNALKEPQSKQREEDHA